MLFRLSDEDRKRLDCPEWIEFTPEHCTVREAVELQRHGYATPAELWKAWAGQYVNGADDDGHVDHIDWEAWIAIIWMALRRAGVHVDYDELDFDIADIDSKLSESEQPETPKDPSTPDTTSDG